MFHMNGLRKDTDVLFVSIGDIYQVCVMEGRKYLDRHV